VLASNFSRSFLLTAVASFLGTSLTTTLATLLRVLIFELARPLLVMLFTHNVYHLLLFASKCGGGLVFSHHLVKVLLSSITLVLSSVLCEALNLIQTLSLVRVLLLHFVVLNGLVELFVLESLSLLFESLNSHRLLQKATFN